MEINTTGWLEIFQGQSSATLYRNGTNLTAGDPSTDISTLPAGYYNFTYNFLSVDNNR